MRRLKALLFFVTILAAGNVFAQVRDSIPLVVADSLKTVYIFADTGKALNRLDAQGRKQGLWEKRYPDGKLRYRGHFVDDNPNGVFKYWWDNDSIQNITIYSEKGRVARTKMFYQNGGLMAIGKFVDRKEDSIWLRYNESLKLISKEQFVLGKKEGKSITFFQNGNVCEVKTWHNGLENGPWQEFFDDGQLELESSYVNGKREGELNAWDFGNTDKPTIHGIYKNDMKEGPWIIFVPAKNTWDTLVYRHGDAVNMKKYQLTNQQLDSLKQQYQQLQQRLDNPGKSQDDSQDPGKDY
jgi:antitoxin component YwqK of YwqJK toxin-antitoxin module